MSLCITIFHHRYRLRCKLTIFMILWTTFSAFFDFSIVSLYVGAAGVHSYTNSSNINYYGCVYGYISYYDRFAPLGHNGVSGKLPDISINCWDLWTCGISRTERYYLCATIFFTRICYILKFETVSWSSYWWRNRKFCWSQHFPGAVFEGDELLNPDQIMPAGYDARALRADCTAVRAGLEAMKTKYANYLGSCTYLGVGKIYAAVSVDSTR